MVGSEQLRKGISFMVCGVHSIDSGSRQLAGSFAPTAISLQEAEGRTLGRCELGAVVIALRPIVVIHFPTRRYAGLASPFRYAGQGSSDLADLFR
jgi:hypothetical protein